jgi:hypothetical protein
MPDHSDTFKVVQRSTQIKAAFSMAPARVIADIGLTFGVRCETGPWEPAGGLEPAAQPVTPAFSGQAVA